MICPVLRPGRRHELRGPAGWSGAGNRQRTVQRHQPGHAVGLHRRGGRPPERWHLPVLAVPRALWEAGRAALQRESGKWGHSFNSGFKIVYWLVHFVQIGPSVRCCYPDSSHLKMSSARIMPTLSLLFSLLRSKRTFL